jgi:hypothetical protein
VLDIVLERIPREDDTSTNNNEETLAGCIFDWNTVVFLG